MIPERIILMILMILFTLGQIICGITLLNLGQSPKGKRLINKKSDYVWRKVFSNDPTFFNLKELKAEAKRRDMDWQGARDE